MAAASVGFADASTLDVNCLNVGMMQEDAFGKNQTSKVIQLADTVSRWLREAPGPAVVGLNEIHSKIADHVQNQLHLQECYVMKATHGSDSLFWSPPG